VDPSTVSPSGTLEPRKIGRFSGEDDVAGGGRKPDETVTDREEPLLIMGHAGLEGSVEPLLLSQEIVFAEILSQNIETEHLERFKLHGQPQAPACIRRSVWHSSSLRVQEMQSSVLDEAEFYGYLFWR